MPDPKTKNRAFLAAYQKGRIAARIGDSNYCPYPDYRGGRWGGMVTWSRAFRRYWLEGWEDGSKELKAEKALRKSLRRSPIDDAR